MGSERRGLAKGINLSLLSWTEGNLKCLVLSEYNHRLKDFRFLHFEILGGEIF